MSYTVGIDIGTTFTAAAVLRGGRAQIVPLGGKADTIPSVVLLREDGVLLTGDAAQRRGISEPHRIAREFKRRFGQPEPVLLAGSPHSPESLTAALLRSVLDEVTKREGGPPSRICLSHPANWGPFKVDLFQHMVRLSGITVPVIFTTEPEAAAVSYAQEQRMEPGGIVAVYDLGGGTFDAAVLRKTTDGFEILGRPEGIEQLGGIDVDAAVFHHATQAVADRLAELDEDDPAAVAAVARLKRECVDAKEALSSDTDVSIPVLLPQSSTEVRLTRAELEQMVRPMLGGTIHALRRALESAHVTPEQLTSVLLVGGSSRMPLVAQMVGAELGRPVAIDTHPKHAVPLGAAWLCETPAVRASAAGGHAAGATAAAVAGTAAAGATAAAAAPGIADPTSDTPRDVAPDSPALPIPVGGGGPTGASRTAAGPFETQVIDTRSVAGAQAWPAPGGQGGPRFDGRPPGAPADTAWAAPQPPKGRRNPLQPIIAAVLAVAAVVLAMVIGPRLLKDDELTATPSKAAASPLSATPSNAPPASGPQAELDALVKQDRPKAAKLKGQWAPQLAAYIVGSEGDDGATLDAAKILALVKEKKAAYPAALLVWSGDYPESFKVADAYVVVVNQPSESHWGALSWCEDEGYGRKECLAKRLSTSGDPDSNTKMRTAPDPAPASSTPPTTTSSSTMPTDTPTDPTPSDPGGDATDMQGPGEPAEDMADEMQQMNVPEEAAEPSQ